MDGKEKSLPKPEPELPKPQIDLPEPEKEITSKSTLASQGQALEPQDENQTSTEKPKRKLPLLKILVAGAVILITLLAFGLIAYLMMAQNKAQVINSYEECVASGFPIMESFPEQCSANRQTFTRELTEEEKKNLDPTEDWETFEKSEYGFSIKYPPFLKPLDLTKTNDAADVSFTDKKGNDVAGNTINYRMNVNRNPNPTLAYFNAPIKSLDEVWQGDEEKEYFDIQGIKAMMLTTTSVNIEDDSRGTTTYIFILKDNTLWTISGGGNNINPSKIKEIKKALTTFKFTDANEISSVDISDWNTYFADGYSFKYPSAWNINYNDINNKLNNISISPIEIRDMEGKTANYINFTKNDNPDNLSIEEYVKLNRFPEDVTYSKYNIGGVEGKRTSELPGIHENDQIFIAYKNNIYQISLTKLPDVEISNNMFEAILSTFQFTE